MIHRFFTGARNVAALSCLIPLLAACGGYYDETGHYTSDNTPYKSNNSHPARPDIPDRGHYSNREDYYDTRGYSYDRRGYYDRNGYYMENNNSLNVPQSMFPARGMCRVWFTSRTPSNQPPVESCNGINSRVPAGAYVIYGG